MNISFQSINLKLLLLNPFLFATNNTTAIPITTVTWIYPDWYHGLSSPTPPEIQNGPSNSDPSAHWHFFVDRSNFPFCAKHKDSIKNNITSRVWGISRAHWLCTVFSWIQSEVLRSQPWSWGVASAQVTFTDLDDFPLCLSSIISFRFKLSNPKPFLQLFHFIHCSNSWYTDKQWFDASDIPQQHFGDLLLQHPSGRTNVSVALWWKYIATARCGVLSVECCFDPLLEGLEGLGFEDLEALCSI